jgi:hypothetical protein
MHLQTTRSKHMGRFLVLNVHLFDSSRDVMSFFSSSLLSHFKVKYVSIPKMAVGAVAVERDNPAQGPVQTLRKNQK